MELDQKSAEAIAQQFFGTSKPLVPLGWGISGYVFLSPDSQTAVKVFKSITPLIANSKFIGSFVD